jgi:hypothetical protein
VDRDSDTLLVTIGDSWTWGSGIQQGYFDAVSTNKEQNDFSPNWCHPNIEGHKKIAQELIKRITF